MAQSSMAEASDPASNTTLSSMDRQEIMDLVYNYSYTYDSKDLEGWLALFAEGAIWSVYAGGSSDPKIVTVSNQERRMLLGPSLEGNQTRHFMTNTILRQTDVDRAEGKTMFCCFITQEPSSSSSSSSGAVSSSPFGVAESVQMSHHLIVTGYYEDEFVRTENGWKFASRKMSTDPPLILPQLTQLGGGGSKDTMALSPTSPSLSTQAES